MIDMKMDSKKKKTPIMKDDGEIAGIRCWTPLCASMLEYCPKLSI